MGGAQPARSACFVGFPMPAANGKLSGGARNVSYRYFAETLGAICGLKRRQRGLST